MIESHPLGPLVRRWSEYAALTPGDCNALLDLPYSAKSFSKDSYIVREGQQVGDCSLLLSGFAYRQKLLRNGSRQIISIHIPTEFVDLQESSPGIRMAMWVDTLLDSSIFREWVVNVGRRDSRARIAHLLCELVLRLKRIGAGQDDTFEFPLTQEQLADATGLTPVHTNRTLQALRKNGLIQLTARSLKILDWDGLREAADFDETYLHYQPRVASRS